MDVDGCGFVLAYGPDGGLVTARDCTPERYRTRCEPALKAAFDREDAARSPEVAAHPDVERRERVAAIRALAVAQTTRARELGDRAGRLRRATADACVHAMRLCRFAAEVIGPGARDAREQAFDAAAPA